MTKSSTIKWGRSKIMIVGEGRAGKSALANSLLGKTLPQNQRLELMSFLVESESLMVLKKKEINGIDMINLIKS